MNCKPSLWGSILINSVPIFSSIAFPAFLSYSIFLSLWPFSSISVTALYSWKYNQSCNLTHYAELAVFLLQMKPLFLSALIVFWSLLQYTVWIVIVFYNPWLFTLIILFPKMLLGCFIYFINQLIPIFSIVWRIFSCNY